MHIYVLEANQTGQSPDLERLKNDSETFHTGTHSEDHNFFLEIATTP